VYVTKVCTRVKPTGMKRNTSNSYRKSLKDIGASWMWKRRISITKRICDE
jgi:hypothetical protein